MTETAYPAADWLDKAAAMFQKAYPDSPLNADMEEMVKQTRLRQRRPRVGELRHCLLCAFQKPWGIWDELTGATVCVECRDKAQKPASAP